MIFKLKVSFILLFCFLVLSGCNEEAEKLSETSVSAVNLITQYYDNLIQYTVDSWELEAFNSSLREIEFTKEEQDEYLKTIEYLKQRKALVETFGKTFPLLDEYIKNKGSEKLKKNVTDLSGNINDLKPLKDNEVILPSEIMGNMSGDIMDLVKYFEIRQLSKTLLSILEKICTLYEKESDMYLSIIEDRNNKSENIINYLIDNELVTSWPMIGYAPKTVELEIIGEKKPAKDDKHKEALKKVLEVKFYRLSYLNEEATKSLDSLMTDLIGSYKDFIEGKKLIFDNVMYLAGRTGEYFGEINEYMKYYTEGESEKETVIYKGNSETKVFHSPSCQYYTSNNTTVKFTSREEAINQGYKPCDICKP